MSRRAAALLALALATAPALGAQTITARPGDGTLTAMAGQSLDVPVVVDMSTHPAQLGAFAMRLTWDPAVLQYQAGMPGSFGAVTISEDSAQDGVLRFAGANPAGVGGTSVTVAIGRFTPIAGATTTMDLQVTQLFAAGTFADLLPSLVTQSATFCPALGRYGDVDADGNVNSRDALIALSNAVGLNVAPFNVALGDVDSDGSTNARDALIILSAAVGIDVSGYRVLATADGACSSGPPVVLAIEPGLVGDLVPGQRIRFEARASGAGGALVPVLDAAWLTSDPGIMGILADGQAVARDTGTVDVIAVRDGRDTAYVTLRVVPRRSVHVVASTATGAVNRVGTAALPFATLQEAMDVAQDGDTVRVRVGRYSGTAVVDHAVTTIGDTLPDGTRPEFAGTGPTTPVAFTVTSPGTVRLEQLAFIDVASAVIAFGGGRLELDGLRATRVASAVSVQAAHHALVLRRSRLSGDGQSGSGVTAFASVDSVRIEDSDIGDFGGMGVMLGRFVRLEVLRTTFRDQYDGLSAGTGDSAVRAGDVLIADSRFLRHASDGVHLDGVGDVTIRGSRFEMLQYDPAVNVRYAGTVRLTADTLNTLQSGGSYWLDVDQADSVVLDSLRGRLLDADGYTYNVPYVRLTRSEFTEVSGYRVLGVSFGGPITAQGVVVVDSVTMTGATSCSQCATGLYIQYARATVDRFFATNLNGAIDVYSDSSLTVTRSRFQSVYRPINYDGPGNRLGQVTVTQSTFRDFNDEAILVYDAAMFVDSNTFDQGWTAISRPSYYGSASIVTVTRNRIANVVNGIEFSIEDSSHTGTVTDNVLTGVENTGIDVSGDLFPDTLQIRFEVLRNSVSCAGTGSSLGVRSADAHALIADNAIACRSGIEVSHYGFSSGAKRDSVLRNTITLVRENPNHGDGIGLSGNLRSTVYGNTITGDSSTAGNVGGIVVRQTGCSPCFMMAAIDSNTVQTTGASAIKLEAGDSITVTRNTVLDVATRNGLAAIQVDGYFRGHVRLYGNNIRRTREATNVGYGFGIYAWNWDTASVAVDSNLLSDNQRGIWVDNFYAAGIAVTRNRIRRSLAEGVQVGGNAAALTITQNNFFQNRFGMRAVAAVSAVNNWWNDASGPACAVGGGCSGGASADSIEAATVTWSPHAASEFTFTPPNVAPPVLRPAAPVTAARMAPARTVAARSAPAILPERRALQRVERARVAARRAADKAEDAAEHERRLQAARTAATARQERQP